MMLPENADTHSLVNSNPFSQAPEEPTRMKHQSFWQRLSEKVESLPTWQILLIAAVIYIPLAFLGFGSDSDSLSVARVGQHYIETLDYVPSRLPGFFVHELFVFILNLLGGSLLSNLGSVAMALITLASCRKLSQSLHVPHATLLTIIMMVQPFFWVSAASTIDYLWALGFALLGFNLLLKRKYTLASLSLAAAIGSRLSTILVIGIFLVFLFFTYHDMRRKLLLTTLATAVIAFLFYIPPIDFLEWDMSRWLVLSTGNPELWTPLLRLGRFAYKNLMFFSLPVILWGICMVSGLLLKKEKPIHFRGDGVFWLSVSAILAVQVLFFRFPIEMEYLLPLLPFFLILTAKLFPNKFWQLWLLLALVLLSNFIWINPARSITPNQTSEVIYGLWLEPGYLLQDIAARLAQIHP
ncbi:MAG: hypothetical protein KBD67_02585 [Anaerolineaceae bacterium]|nr:hypothetical protein [Anaerolineaceae bacterium]